MNQLSLDFNLTPAQPASLYYFQEILSSLQVHPGSLWPDRFGQALRQKITQSSSDRPKVLSLFTGCGGLDLGFHDAGFEIVQMVEFEEKFVRTLQQNVQPGKLLETAQATCIDIQKYCPDPTLKVDFIIGGPPCQTFSAAGRRAAGVAGIDDARGRLFQDYVRILKIFQPKGFLFENVAGIIGAQKGQAWRQIQQAFQEAGYKLFYRILDAADYGVPQHRERLFIVGLKDGLYLFPSPTHGPDSPDQQPFYTAGEAVQNADISQAEWGIKGRYGHLLDAIPPGLNYSFYTQEMGHPRPIFSWRSKFSDFLYKADPEMPVRTLKAQGGQYTGPFSWENRRFTVVELKRLQTIPDDYELVGNRSVCIQQIGNSVPPQLARILALSILEQVMGVSIPFSLQYLPPERELGFRKRKRKLSQTYRKKARIALSGMMIPRLKNHHNFQEETVRFLSSHFHWSQINSSDSQKILIRYDLHPKNWRIIGTVKTNLNSKTIYSIEIIANSNCKHLFLKTCKIQLLAAGTETYVFTALWKALEEKLQEVIGIADLVQFSGYYQYQSRIQICMTLTEHLTIDPFWRVVQCTANGQGIAQQMPAEQLSKLWNIRPDQLLFYLQNLRKLGYEIRNHHTNPQIPENYYLIPYQFPTLTPKSIQLYKSLLSKSSVSSL
jgi:DNA (cytosine-5)-methyltransferase 1